MRTNTRLFWGLIGLLLLEMGSSAAAQTTILQDNFNVGSTTNLAGRTSQSPNASVWTTTTSTGTAVVSATSNDTFATSADQDSFYLPYTPSSANYTVEADIKELSGPSGISFIGISGRASTDGTSGYTLVYVSTGGTTGYWQVSWVAPGGLNGIVGSTLPMSLTFGRSYHVKLSMIGSVVSGYVTDTVTGVTSTIASGTETHVTATGYAAIDFYGLAFTATTGLHIDNFKVALPPLGIGNAAVTATTPTSITVSCPAATNGSGTYTYQWYRSEDPQFGTSVAITGATSTTYTDNAVLPDHVYFYRVTVTDAASTAATSGAVYSDDAGIGFGHPENPGYYAQVLTEPPGATLTTSNALSIGIIGDSNSGVLTGVNPNATTYIGQEFATNLPKLLGVRSVTVDDEAIGGTSTDNWLPTGTRSVTDASHPHTDYPQNDGGAGSGGLNIYRFAVARFNTAGVTVIEINHGTNDAGANRSNSVAFFKANLQAIDAALFNDVPTLKCIIHSGAIFPWYFGSASAIQLELQYRAALRSLPNGRNIFLGDMNSWNYIANHPEEETISQGIHLNDAGVRSVGLMRSLGVVRVLYEAAHPKGSRPASTGGH